MTVKNFGEEAVGDWILSVTDTKEGSYISPGECQDGGYFAFHLDLGLIDCSFFDERSSLCDDPTLVSFTGKRPREM